MLVSVRLVTAGALVAAIGLYRQLSGVLVAMGLLTFLLVEASSDRDEPGPKGLLASP